jgi:hypothetical protein
MICASRPETPKLMNTTSRSWGSVVPSGSVASTAPSARKRARASPRSSGESRPRIRNKSTSESAVTSASALGETPDSVA